ncbi:MAG: sel1 repeat family protein [Ignavibacterium sp.]|nr:MAG: sel1 repeat family protein [Ignavibacterium sp.]
MFLSKTLKLFSKKTPNKNFEVANKYLSKRQLKKAVNKYKLSAEQGDTRAMYALAILYELGIVVKQSDLNYSHWMLKAAQLGHNGALGECYIDGNGVEKAPKRGLKLLLQYAMHSELISDTSETFVLGSLGGHYLNGEITEQNIELAKKFLLMAAQNGNPIAMMILESIQN